MKIIKLPELQAIKYLNNKGIFEFKPRFERFLKPMKESIVNKYNAEMTIFENEKNIPIGLTGISRDNSNNIFNAGTMVFSQFRNQGYAKKIIEYNINNLPSNCNYYTSISNPLLYNTMNKLNLKELSYQQLPKYFFNKNFPPCPDSKYYYLKT